MVKKGLTSPYLGNTQEKCIAGTLSSDSVQRKESAHTGAYIRKVVDEVLAR